MWLSSEAAAEYSIPRVQLLKELLLPQWYAFCPEVAGDPAIVSFYAGPVALGLATFAVSRGRRAERWLAAAAGAALLVTLGRFIPGYSKVGIFHLFRFPANWLVPAMAAVGWVFAVGLPRVGQT